jgi:hypothetical protein
MTQTIEAVYTDGVPKPTAIFPFGTRRHALFLGGPASQPRGTAFAEAAVAVALTGEART